MALRTETHEDGKKYFVIDQWNRGQVTRTFVADYEDIRPTREGRPVPFTLFVTSIGDLNDRAAYGKNEAPISVFIIKYSYGEGSGREDSLSMNIKEYGQKNFDRMALTMISAESFTEWREASRLGFVVSLQDFAEGNYPEPPGTPECERHLRKKQTPPEN